MGPCLGPPLFARPYTEPLREQAIVPSLHGLFVAEPEVEWRTPNISLILSWSFPGSQAICLGKPIKEIQFL